jgi:hypothetical protein
VKPLPKASDPFAEAACDESSSSRFQFKLPAAAAAILSAVANSSGGSGSSNSSSRRNSNRAASVEGMPQLPPIATAGSSKGLEGSGRQLSRPAEKVEGLPWEMFDLGFHQVKGKGLMKTHLLKVRAACLVDVKVKNMAELLWAGPGFTCTGHMYRAPVQARSAVGQIVEGLLCVAVHC